MNYSAYLASKHWKDTKERVYKRRPKVCAICSCTEKIHLHHRRYQDSKGTILYREQNKDLVPLCSGCHRLWHNAYGTAQKMSNKHINRIKTLIALGWIKREAFGFVTQGSYYRAYLKYYKRKWGMKRTDKLPYEL